MKTEKKRASMMFDNRVLRGHITTSCGSIKEFAKRFGITEQAMQLKVEYLGCGVTKAIQIKNQALREFGGSIRYLSQYVTVDSVMNCIGTTREREIEMIRKIKSDESEA